MQEFVLGILFFVIGAPIIAIVTVITIRLFSILVQLGERVERRLLKKFDERNEE